ncbi:MAG: hypothetical protein D6B26_03645 [Spirochaetaceae bacterium]|nr:MAG: hypothetical protein D6B26_03645 [Spirochaetaceae bacterium]
MKKIVFLLAVMAVVFGCATKEDRPEVPADKATARFEILEHKGTVFGTDTPDWVIKSLDGSAALEALPEYEGKYVIVAEQTGSDLTAVQRWVTNFVAASEFSRRVSLRVEQYFSGALAGDLDDAASYLEEVVNTLSAARFSGVSQEADWWVRVRWFDEKGKVEREEYRVLVLMTIAKDTLDEQVAQAIEDADTDAELNDNEQKVRDLVQQGRFM